MASNIRQALRPGVWLTAKQRLEKGIWPWAKGVRARLPMHFKVRYCEAMMKEPKPVHFRKEEGKWKVDEWGVRTPIQNIPIPVKYPVEADEGLWGGEGFVEGMKKKNNNPKKPKYPHIWRPQLSKHLFYSEILDRHMEITVTRRTLDQIDECYGFDAYIIQTHQVDLKSKLGMKLKREMLTRLVTKDFLHNDPQRRDELCEKYRDYLLPLEEVEWLGLTIEEAEYKQETMEEEERIANTKPLKQVYMQELVQQLKDGEIIPEEKESGVSSMMGKLNPFKSKSDS